MSVKDMLFISSQKAIQLIPPRRGISPFGGDGLSTLIAGEA